MRFTKALATAFLVGFCVPSQANIIWDFFLFGSTGYFETEGTLDADGAGGGEIVDLVFTSSTRADMPLTGWVGGGSIGFGSGGLGGADLSYSVDVPQTIMIGSLPVVLPFTQSFTGGNAISTTFPQLEVGGIGDYVACAKDIEFLLNMNVPVDGDHCIASNFVGTARIFFEAPRNAVAAVSEPSSLALLGLGALALIRRIGKREKVG